MRNAYAGGPDFEMQQQQLYKAYDEVPQKTFHRPIEQKTVKAETLQVPKPDLFEWRMLSCARLCRDG